MCQVPSPITHLKCISGLPAGVGVWLPPPEKPGDPFGCDPSWPLVATPGCREWLSGPPASASSPASVAFPPPCQTPDPEGSGKGFCVTPLPSSSAVGPLVKPVLISWLETREPWGLNVQGAQPKSDPGAAPAGESQTTCQILRPRHLVFSVYALSRRENRGVPAPRSAGREVLGCG